MADSAKRSRRPDSASMWDDDDRSRRRGGGGRHRSRSRDRHDDGGGKGRRGGGGRKNRSTSRDRHARRRDDDRARSRSPRASDARDSARRRSPPRGPRSNARGGGADNATNGAHGGGGGGGGKKGSSSSLEFAGGPTQPSSKEYTRRVQSRVALKNGKAGGGGDDGGMDVDTAEDAADAELMRVMGFASFSSTQNTKVPGNSKNYAVRKEKKTEYRQYMNRVGGFNRPLSPSREA